MPERQSAKDDLLTVGEAANLLNVTVSTLRNWDRAKKLTARRHPINGYRLYRRSKVLALREKINGSRGTPRAGGER